MSNSINVSFKNFRSMDRNREKREERENESVNYRRVRKLLTIGPTDDRAGHKEVSLTRQREREIKRKEAT